MVSYRNSPNHLFLAPSYDELCQALEKVTEEGREVWLESLGCAVAPPAHSCPQSSFPVHSLQLLHHLKMASGKVKGDGEQRIEDQRVRLRFPLLPFVPPLRSSRREGEGRMNRVSQQHHLPHTESSDYEIRSHTESSDYENQTPVQGGFSHFPLFFPHGLFNTSFRIQLKPTVPDFFSARKAAAQCTSYFRSALLMCLYLVSLLWDVYTLQSRDQNLDPCTWYV